MNVETLERAEEVFRAFQSAVSDAVIVAAIYNAIEQAEARGWSEGHAQGFEDGTRAAHGGMEYAAGFDAGLACARNLGTDFVSTPWGLIAAR